MNREEIYEVFRANPVICGLNNVNEIDKVLESPSEIVFLLTGDIMNLSEILQKIKSRNKLAFIHLDLIKGFSKDAKAMEYLSKTYDFDGIMSTKVSLLKLARSYDLFIIQRLFMLDSSAYEMSINSVQTLNPDAIEIMPGIVPKIIKRVKLEINIPIIAGGLIDNKQEIIECLKSGASCISTTKQELWYV